MKRILALLSAVLALTAGAVAQTTWKVDNVHSNVKFAVSHLIISEVEGSFKVYSGALTFGNSDLTNAEVDFAVDVASINTDNVMRDGHLRSDDFFNAEQFPKMTFKSTAWKKLDEKRYELEGDLTIRDITKPVSFAVVFGGTIKDPWGNMKAGFKATTTINRFEYGLKWNGLTEAGGMTVGKEVTIVLNLEFTQNKASQ
ncbi:MAG: YceI family protein [Bacteroidota bacterium]